MHGLLFLFFMCFVRSHAFNSLFLHVSYVLNQIGQSGIGKREELVVEIDKTT